MHPCRKLSNQVLMTVPKLLLLPGDPVLLNSEAVELLHVYFQVLQKLSRCSFSTCQTPRSRNTYTPYTYMLDSAGGILTAGLQISFIFVPGNHST